MTRAAGKTAEITISRKDSRTPVVFSVKQQSNTPLQAYGVLNLQRCRAAGYLTLAAVAKAKPAWLWLVARGHKTCPALAHCRGNKLPPPAYFLKAARRSLTCSIIWVYFSSFSFSSAILLSGALERKRSLFSIPFTRASSP